MPNDNNGLTANTSIDSKHYDVIIAGGGLSGCLMALSLSSLKKANDQPISIAIIDPNPINSGDIKQSFDDRVLALSHASACYLKSLHVWQALSSYANPIEHIHVSDRGHYGKARIHAHEHHVEALGYVVEMSTIAATLINTLQPCDYITWHCPASIADIEWQQHQVTVQLTTKKTLTAKLLIACDGAQSVCRQAANIQSHMHDYQQSAVIANVIMTKPHDNMAYERFTEFGPIAMLPMAESRSTAERKQCSLVWTHQHEQAQAIAQLGDNEFSQALVEAFGTWLGDVENVSKRSVFPLKLIQAEVQTYHRMALIGNASHTIHPIAGQGFNLGLRDVQCLTTLIEAHLLNQANDDLGSFDLLAKYQQQRAQDQQQVINITDSMVTLFSNQYAPLVAGRNIGIKAMNYCMSLQSLFVNKTMGY